MVSARSLFKHRDRMVDLKQAFAAGLKSDEALVRQASVEALGDLGLDAADVRPEVQKLLNDPSLQVRTSASEALKKIPSRDRNNEQEKSAGRIPALSSCI